MLRSIRLFFHTLINLKAPYQKNTYVVNKISNKSNVSKKKLVHHIDILGWFWDLGDLGTLEQEFVRHIMIKLSSS